MALSFAYRRPFWTCLLVYMVIFGSLFLRFPLEGRLPGNTDSLLAIALSNIFFEKLVLFFSGDPTYTALFPARDVMSYGENCYGLASIFLVFKALIREDIRAYYLFITTLFTLNSVAILAKSRDFR